jgi:RNA-directed DNA polymerase
MVMSFSKEHMQALHHRVCAVRSISDVAGLLQTGPLELMRLRFEKPYFVFEVRKQKGKQRLIEAPGKDLKQILRKLNDHLQAAYFFCRSQAAYGFVQQPKNANKKRNILTNAKLHCGKKYMVNIDLKDFFHQISRIRVAGIFRSAPFEFNTEVSGFLSELTTYNDRLPMGSPTSPALSNFAARDLDADLLDYARQNKLMYSRYVDDLTFSSHSPISIEQYYTIQDMIGKKGFTMNMEKVKWMNEQDEKTVTGLILKDKPEVPEGFLKDLEGNLKRFKHVMEFSSVTKAQTPDDWIEQFKEHLQGKLRFLQMVYGHRHPVTVKMKNMYEDAYNTLPFVESFSWNDFPYA